MKVLIADKFQASGIDALRSLGLTVESHPDTSPDDLPALMSKVDPDVLVVRSTKVRAPVFETAKKLSLVVRAGAGVDNIDMPAASARGVFVANCPGKNSVAVAELAWGLILSADRRIPDQTIELREGKWNKKEYSKARGLYGRTLGVIGTGNIALEIIKRAKAFGMDVACWSRSLTDVKAKEMGVAAYPSPVAVAKVSDVVTVNVAGNKETEGLINKAFIDALRDGAIFINTSRGSVVDEPALLDAVKKRGIRAGLDVFMNEPGPNDKEFRSEIAASAGVYGTHHVGASTDQAQDAIADETVRVIRTYLITGEIPNVVNQIAKTSATRLLVVRHLNKPGVLAHVIGALGSARVNIEEMDNVIFDGGKAACARIQLDSEPDAQVMDRINRGSPDVLSVDLTVID